MKTEFSKDLSQYRRIVVKLGSSLIVDSGQQLRRTWLNSLADDLVQLKADGAEVLIVSSGAIALGRTQLDSIDGKTSLTLAESQAAAAVGQIALSRAFEEVFRQRSIATGQVLVTIGDTETRHRYLNARATINTLLKWGAVPIINENDTVATSEIRYGDNDRLAARVATMVDADLLILFSDVDGLYTAPPNSNADAKRVELVDEVTAAIEAMAGAAASHLSRGGMRTKIAAAKIATASGVAMIIGSGQPMHPVSAIRAGGTGTWFSPSKRPVNQRKKWIAGVLHIHGTLVIDAGACQALRAGKSLLPAGTVGVEGTFESGDTVSVVNEQGQQIACGLVQCDSADAVQMVGLQSAEIGAKLGQGVRVELIHRDDLVLMSPADNP